MRNTSLEAKDAFDGLMTKKNIARSTELIDRALDMNFLSLLAVNNYNLPCNNNKNNKRH